MSCRAELDDLYNYVVGHGEKEMQRTSRLQVAIKILEADDF